MFEQTTTNMISILMPIKNGEEFMESSIMSVFNQTWNQWELLIGINGVPETSSIFNKAEHYQKKRPFGQVKIMNLTSVVGKADTLNAMVIKTSQHSEYVAILDVDDIWHKDKLTIQVGVLGNYDVIGTQCVYFGDIEGVVPKIPFGDFSRTFNFLDYNPVINSSSLIRKTFAYWDNSDELFGIEDYELWLRLRKLRCSFFNFAEILVKHRIHKNSAFNSRGNGGNIEKLLQKYDRKFNRQSIK